MKQVEITPGLDLDNVLRQIREGNVVLTRQGHAVALLSEFDDDDLYWYAREHDPSFVASLKKAREQAAKGDTISLEELKKQLGIE